MIFNGFFITFEGGDGAGKSTLIDKLSDFFLKKDLQAIKTREPGSTLLREQLRNLILMPTEYKMSYFAELCLYLASRAQHIQDVILPALNSKKIVFCDRFNDSTIAYQGFARNLGMDKVEEFCQFISQNLKPDLTFYLDIDPEIGLERVKKAAYNKDRKGLDRLESENIVFHEKIREGFHILSKKEPNRIFVIDANLSSEKIFHVALDIIKEKLKIDI